MQANHFSQSVFTLCSSLETLLLPVDAGREVQLARVSKSYFAA
jgi:hypothetical protein